MKSKETRKKEFSILKKDIELLKKSKKALTQQEYDLLKEVLKDDNN